MKHEIYYHRNGNKVVPEALIEEVLAAIEEAVKCTSATSCRTKILGTLRDKKGWSNETRVSADTNISITSKKQKTGLCLQTGNMSRFYADLLKLECLYNAGHIESAIYLLPDKALARKWGQNIANYERFTAELQIFQGIIHTPQVVIGIVE